MGRTPSLSCPHAPKRNSNTARTRCGPPRPAAQSGASVPRCLPSEGGSQEGGRAVLPPQGDVWGGLDCNAGCNTWLEDWSIPCKMGEGRRAEGAALGLRLGVGAEWGCCGGWGGGPGAGTLPPGSGKRTQASCGSPLVNVVERTWSLTPQRPEERCQVSGGCKIHKKGPQDSEHLYSDSTAVKEAGSRAHGSSDQESPRTLGCPRAWPGPGDRTRCGLENQSPAS